MAKYEVKLVNGKIEAGLTNKAGKWTGTEVTQDALAAVRDHLLTMTSQEQKDVAYAWQYQNGKTLLLKLEEKDSEEIQPDNNEEEKGE